MNKLKKTDGKRSKKHRPKGAEHLNFASGTPLHQTTLILTEGDSADAYRLKFVSQVPQGKGRDFFGSLPLHGKPRNVLKANFLQIAEDVDFKAIKAMLGLKEEVDYSRDENYRKLNYGNLLIMPDPDNDGKHILGLVLLFFLHRFPSLVQRGYIKFMRIPVVRVDINGVHQVFYSMSAYKQAVSVLPPNSKIGTVDYFKGLGSSEDQHIKKDFQTPRVVTFKIDEDTSDRIMLAFHKTASHLRKDWVTACFNREISNTDSMIELPISLFIDHEFIDYTIENIIRSIPDAIDGMKESQRKAFFAALRKLGKKNKVKVAQVASHAAEITCYKHGETCLADTIVMMTYDFLGANNMPYFQARGQFGCVDPDTPVLQWDGSVKLAKDISTADILVGDDGNPRHISKIVKGVDSMYNVTQKYGKPYRVNSQHILTLHFPKHKVIYWKACRLSMEYYDIVEKRVKSKSIGYTNSTKDYAEKQMREFAATIPDGYIFDIDIQTYMSFPPNRRGLFRSVRCVQPLKWPKQDVPIDPYIFGMGIASAEDIPEVYSHNDIETRLQLLAGLIDTDGCLKFRESEAKQFFEIEKHGHLIDSVEYIAKSLGFKTRILITSDKKVLTINGDIYRIPTRLPRKRATKTTCQNFIGDKIEIQYDGIGEYVGWYIDGNERFLLGDFTVTHNTRNKGGKDAANPRYTCISLPWWTPYIYRKGDKGLEKRVVDEGDEQECESFFPILPMHLINGVVGIGTAWSTNIPQHNPLDIAFWLQQRLLQDLQSEQNHVLPLIKPWYKGFTGQILCTGNGFITEGRFSNGFNGNVVIEELPVGKWTQDYDDQLSTWEDEGIISGYISYCTDTEVKFIIDRYLDGAPSLRKLKLISKHSYNNMTVLYRIADRGIQPRIYNSVTDLLEDFYKLRLAKYDERKAYILEKVAQEIIELQERARYVYAVAVSKELEVRNRPKAAIYEDMTRMSFNHDFLKKVRTIELTVDEIPALQGKIDQKQRHREELEKVSPQQTWYNEIEEFVVKYTKKEKYQRSTFESCNPLMTLTLVD